MPIFIAVITRDLDRRTDIVLAGVTVPTEEAGRQWLHGYAAGQGYDPRDINVHIAVFKYTGDGTVNNAIDLLGAWFEETAGDDAETGQSFIDLKTGMSLHEIVVLGSVWGVVNNPDDDWRKRGSGDETDKGRWN